jgi:hypothetical protein
VKARESQAGDPWVKFFTSDWRSDPELRSCGLAARGLWIEMICLMHEAVPYGHLVINGKPPADFALARQVGATLRELRSGLQELAANNVYSVTDAGVIFSRRMVRAAERSRTNQINGAKGGNPALMDKAPVKDSVENSDNRETNPQKPEARSQIPEAREELYGATLSRRPAQTDSEPARTPKKATHRSIATEKMAFAGSRLKVWRWLHDEFMRSLGSNPFDLLGWYPKLDDEMCEVGPVSADDKWIRQRFYVAAGIK